ECGIARITPASLQLDSGFGTAGKATLSFDAGSFHDNCTAIAAQPDGKLVLAADVDSHVGVARLTASGAQDTAFGLRQLQQLLGDVDPFAVSRVAVQPSGKIVLATAAAGSDPACPQCNRDFAIIRMNTDGTL